MALDFDLTIPTPCRESWQNMLPQAGGRFCEECNKTVIDFTTLNPDQIIQTLHKQRGKVCGRFQADQLKHYAPPMQVALPSVKVSKFVLTAGITCATTVVSSASDNPPLPSIHLTETSTPNISADTTDHQQTQHNQSGLNIKGQVLIDHGKQLERAPSVSVLLKGTKIGTTTDKEGYYTLHLEEQTTKPVTLVFRYLGYRTLEKTVPTKSTDKVDLGQIVLSLDIQALTGEVVIVHSNLASRMWWNVKGFFARVF